MALALVSTALDSSVGVFLQAGFGRCLGHYAFRYFSCGQAERQRETALRPYLVAAPKCGVVGTSKYADRLRRQVVSASRDPARRVACVTMPAGTLLKVGRRYLEKGSRTE